MQSFIDFQQAKGRAQQRLMNDADRSRITKSNPQLCRVSFADGCTMYPPKSQDIEVKPRVSVITEEKRVSPPLSRRSNRRPANILKVHGNKPEETLGIVGQQIQRPVKCMKNEHATSPEPARNLLAPSQKQATWETQKEPKMSPINRGSTEDSFLKINPTKSANMLRRIRTETNLSGSRALFPIVCGDESDLLRRVVLFREYERMVEEESPEEPKPNDKQSVLARYRAWKEKYLPDEKKVADETDESRQRVSVTLLELNVPKRITRARQPLPEYSRCDKKNISDDKNVQRAQSVSKQGDRKHFKEPFIQIASTNLNKRQVPANKPPLMRSKLTEKFTRSSQARSNTPQARNNTPQSPTDIQDFKKSAASHDVADKTHCASRVWRRRYNE